MLRLLIVLLWLPLAGFAQTYPAPLSDTVNDYANLLPPEAAARVNAALQTAREETGIHIVLATIAAQADYGGTGRFADFATGWFNSWGIGDATRNDGILILVAEKDREMRIALGAAYDPVWDGRAQRVVDTAMLPAFRNDDYAKGLEDGALMAIEQLARPFAAHEAVTEDSGFPAEPWLDKVIGGVMFAGIAGVILWGLVKSRLRDFAVRFKRCPNCGARRLQLTQKTTLEPAETTQGQGLRIETCGHCGHERRDSFTLPSKAAARAKTSSSSSGFGGGRSGGGGASGKW
jgi:uncharacterized protein